MYPNDNSFFPKVTILLTFVVITVLYLLMALFLKQDIQREKGEPVTDDIEIFNFEREMIKPRPFSFDEKKDGEIIHYEYL